ncbi:DUF4433 domain-containing protein [Cyanobium sp. ATX 6A2]|uniref:DarT ssDNA thymidine ADP-ribosyltransferase family protein n=1 Tax=Cyanobium sp. ATX 6A2 TaxID=2823700 RepID=UPI0020CBBBF0|nr:DarT ssDNA thymidine ADP-ribosyltransferase family protein [Cyanobium sp. ATX 6A2]MCP9887854.1 DUF4433 domain-containing protein [Cyanobium sp. ATX 6A2]
MIRKLFHLTHLHNVPGIARRGLLCRTRIHSEALPYVDLSEPTCQARRTHRQVGEQSVDLHRYVPLFLNPRNPMLFRLLRSLRESGHAGELAILEVSGEPAQWHASLVADGIASSADTQLFHADDPAADQALDWWSIRCSSWGDAPRDVRRKTMAEVLVNGTLAPRHIRKVWVQQPSALKTLVGRLTPADLAHCQVDERNDLFYA